jgi:hypothetical protein
VGHVRVNGSIILKWVLNKYCARVWDSTDSIGIRLLSCPIRGGEYLDGTSDYKLLKNTSNSCVTFVLAVSP